MGGRGTVSSAKYKALNDAYDMTGRSITVTKSVRHKYKTEYNENTKGFSKKLKRIDNNHDIRMTKKEARLVEEVVKSLRSVTEKSAYSYFNLKDTGIKRVHLEDRQEWYNRHRMRELKGDKNAFNRTKDAPFILKKDKKGNHILVITHSATEQGTKSLNARYKNSKGTARNIKEAIIREQAKVIYQDLKVRHPKVYNSIHNGLITYNNSPTSRSAGASIKKYKRTSESFADAYLLNYTKRKSSVGKRQRTLVRGAMYWLSDGTSNSSKLFRLEKQAKAQYNTVDPYKSFISKYTSKKRY